MKGSDIIGSESCLDEGWFTEMNCSENERMGCRLAFGRRAAVNVGFLRED